MKIGARIKGMEDIYRMTNPDRYKTPVANTVEKHARLQANTASNRAPFDNGLLAGSIPPSVKAFNGDQTGWSYGSPVEYAAVQEYTHKTKKGFMRKTMFEGEQPLVSDLAKTVKRTARGL
ncbi:hypothetical protein [Bacillus gaemokensis]|uniref:Phage protein n=1 Tax=Bacillus gaemokensis TaxID=574375 RepID=A0A073K7E3_9BACI|nr:hypothetical protein [Bacillus gaemokensis]KEK22470.1 hypothetical protein BAGA_18865 [Bacillus gaemokensis]KYG28835.1 hypothetical protein AZF08_14010 [Bacillus gaemokensis]